MVIQHLGRTWIVHLRIFPSIVSRAPTIIHGTLKSNVWMCNGIAGIFHSFDLLLATRHTHQSIQQYMILIRSAPNLGQNFKTRISGKVPEKKNQKTEKHFFYQVLIKMQFCIESNVFLLYNYYIVTQCILLNKYILLCNVKKNSRRRRNNHTLIH